MMTFLLDMTPGARAVAQTDPHGWILTAVSVSVVFAALLLLYCIYAISGGIASGRFKERILERRGRRAERKGISPDEETAAAIAVALFLQKEESIHDTEPGHLTYTNQPGPWADKSLTFRKYPR